MSSKKFSNKRKTKWLVPAVLAVLAMALGLIVFRDKLFPKKTELTFPNKTANLVLDGMDVESIIESEPAMIAAHYPVTAFPKINESIASWVNQELDEFRAEQAKHQASTDEEKSEFYVTFEAYKYKGLLSFRFEEYTQSNNQANGVEKIKTMVFDTSDEQPVTLQSLLIAPDYLSVLSRRAYDNFKDQDGFNLNLELLQEGLEPKKENFEHFIVTESDLEITFDQYQIAARSMGAPVYKMPIAEVEQIRGQPIIDQAEAARQKEQEKQNEKDNLAQVPDRVTVSQEDLDALKGKKLLALTFDDGPHPTNTTELLDFLKSEEVRVTFFVLGSRVAAYPNIVRRMAAEGHQVGSHTYNHKQLTTLDEADLEYEINATNAEIQNALGFGPAALRPPYGAYNGAVLAKANLPIILWDIDPEDWKYRNAETVFNNIVPKAKDGDIILLHDIHPTSVQAVKSVVKRLKDDGFTFVTVDTLIRVRKGEPQNGTVYSSAK
jgi:peptidoglycan/xylan/chitin deacetylase (PgdA/CDA1 family)